MWYKSPEPEEPIEEDVTSKVKEPEIKFDKGIPGGATTYFCGDCGHKLGDLRTDRSKLIPCSWLPEYQDDPPFTIEGLCYDMTAIEGTCPKCEKTWDLSKTIEVVDKTDG